MKQTKLIFFITLLIEIIGYTFYYFTMYHLNNYKLLFIIITITIMFVAGIIIGLINSNLKYFDFFKAHLFLSIILFAFITFVITYDLVSLGSNDTSSTSGIYAIAYAFCLIIYIPFSSILSAILSLIEIIPNKIIFGIKNYKLNHIKL